MRTPDLSPRHVLDRTFGALRADLPAYVLLALLLVGIPTVVSDSELPKQAQYVVMAVAGLLEVLLNTVLTHNVLARLDGKPATLRASLGAGLRFWPLAFAVQLVSGIAVLLGLVLLVVPGVVLALRWLVPVPVLMAEGLGLGDSLRRSTELTDGSRKPLLGLVLAWAVAFVAAPPLLISAMVDGGAVAWQIAALDMVFDMAGALTGAAGLAVLYVELRGPPLRNTQQRTTMEARDA